jgi:hypothetical protein
VIQLLLTCILGLEGDCTNATEDCIAIIGVFIQRRLASLMLEEPVRRCLVLPNARQGIKMQMSLYSHVGKGMTVFSGEYTRYATDVRAGLLKILEVLRAGKIAIFHLNEPDRRTDFQITVQEVDKLHKGGKFEIFGLGNFMSRKVSQICGISKKNGWTMPSAYQGSYNAMYLTTKSEPFPCFRD